MIKNEAKTLVETKKNLKEHLVNAQKFTKQKILNSNFKFFNSRYVSPQPEF